MEKKKTPWISATTHFVVFVFSKMLVNFRGNLEGNIAHVYTCMYVRMHAYFFFLQLPTRVFQLQDYILILVITYISNDETVHQ